MSINMSSPLPGPILHSSRVFARWGAGRGQGQSDCTVTERLYRNRQRTSENWKKRRVKKIEKGKVENKTEKNEVEEKKITREQPPSQLTELIFYCRFVGKERSRGMKWIFRMQCAPDFTIIIFPSLSVFISLSVPFFSPVRFPPFFY